MYRFIETIRIEDGKVCNLNYHTTRFNQTRFAFWKNAPFINLEEVVLPPNIPSTQKCRIFYGKEIEDINYSPYSLRQVYSLQLLEDNKIDYAYKKADRERINMLFSQRGMADDILVVRNGYLTDTSIANIALYNGNEWVTPSLPLLKGTKRAELLDKHQIVEKAILLSQISDYSHIMLFNAMIGWKQMMIPLNNEHLWL